MIKGLKGEHAIDHKIAVLKKETAVLAGSDCYVFFNRCGNGIIRDLIGEFPVVPVNIIINSAFPFLELCPAYGKDGFPIISAAYAVFRGHKHLGCPKRQDKSDIYPEIDGKPFPE